MKVLIFDHTNSKKQIDKAMSVVNKYTPFPIFWSVVPVPPTNTRFSGKQLNGNYYVDPQWFKDTYTSKAQGCDFCVAFFTFKQYNENQKKNIARAESLNQNFGVSEIVLTGSFTKREKRGIAPKVYESEFVTRLLHEMSHGMFKHKLKTLDVTHYYHYEQKNLLLAIKQWKMESNRDILFKTALGCIGTDASPNDLAPDEFGCAETVNAIHKKAFGKEIGGGLSTYNMYQALKTSPLFIKVDQPLAGDIVISPTGYGNGTLPNGHVGIVGDGVIMSNDSKSGLFLPNYTLQTWKSRYVLTGGYPMLYYRRA